MKKFTFLTFILMLAFTVFGQKGYINPAAKYAEILGYRYEITSTKGGGEIGMVHLPDGRTVNAWDFYKGKVAQEFSYGAKLGFDVETEVVKENGYSIERAVCVRSNKGVEERIPLLKLMEMNGDPLNAEVERKVPSAQELAKVDPNFKAAKSLPTSFDWRNYNGHSYIGTPRDQGGCGSCYAFGATACAEGTYNVATGSYDGNTADFAESYIIWCLSQMSAYSGHFGGCNGADYAYQELQALVDVGTVNESYFPYSDADNQSCSSAASNAPKIQFASWHRVACSDIDAIKTAIMTYGVVDAAVYVTTNFQNYTGGVFSDNNTSCTGSPCENTTTNHAISLVGWGHDATYGDYWILRNSWGSSWGESGYMRLAVTSAHVACSVSYLTYQDVPQPPVAAFSANKTTVVVGNTVSFTDQSTNGPTSWSWSFDGGTPSTSSSQNPTVTYNTVGTYNVSLTATNNEGSDVETKTGYINVVSELPPDYCESASNSSYYEWIAGVDVGEFSNTSGAATYTDFTSMTANLNAGQTYNITLTPDFRSSTYSEYWKIWIDLNHDGDFDDANENVFDAGSTSKSAVSGTITIPSGTASVTTRMRVSMKYNGAPTACENTFGYGEVEDYTVHIGGGDAEAPTAPANLSSSNVTMTSVNLSWNASTDNVGVTGYDIYQNGSYIANTASISYSVTGLNAGTSYSYYVVAKDAANNESDHSNTVNITTLTDTQAPTVPTGLASSGVSKTGFTLSWNASSDNVGVTTYNIYQNGSYLNSTSGTSYSVTGLSASTTYAYYVTAEDAAGNVSSASSSLNVTTLDDNIEYCASKGNNCSYEWIDVVGLNDLYNETGKDGGYGDYTNLTANVSLGSTYTVSVSAGFKSRTYTEYFKVWIDYNVDGTFDSDELVVSGSVSDGEIYTADITIPTDAAIGQTRMRVSMKYNSAQTACESFSYGEVEDYTVNITGVSSPMARTVSGKTLGNDELAGVKVYPNPAKDELTVNVPYSNAKVQIINSTGAVVKKIVLEGNQKVINISDLSNGLYIISVEDDKGPITETFIKQ